MASHSNRSELAETARQRSRAVWDEMAPGWFACRDLLWDMSRPVAEWLVRKLDPHPGQIVLDLAAGAGETGLLAARRLGESGRLISTDFAPQMVAAAQTRAQEMGVTNVEFRVLNAERMDLPSASVDGVICRWGYMLMVDPAAALAETRRVLRPGGRLAFSVFAAPQQNPWASIVGGVLAGHGHMPPPDPGTPGIFALADSRRIRDLVTGAGFAEPEIEEMSVRWRFSDQDTYWRFLYDAAGAFSPVLRALSPEARAAVHAAVDEATQPYRAHEGYDFPGAVLNVATS